MNICKPLLTIIVASMLSGLAPQVMAGSPVCKVKITSSTIKIVKQEAFWQVSGDCLEKITDVSLARDDGDGYEDLVFPADFEKSSAGLTIPVKPRAGGIVGSVLIGEHILSSGQYLLQAKSCKIVGKGKKKCKLEDEAFIPAVGDQMTIDTLIAIDTKIQSDPVNYLLNIKKLFKLN